MERDPFAGLYELDRSPMRGSSREYVVLSRYEAEDRFHQAYHQPHALISIVDPGDAAARIQPHTERRGILRLQFDDVRSRESGRSVLYDETMAAHVAGFVVGLKPELRLVVHCFAGISRSAGMVAGIAKAVGDKDVMNECWARYMPNTLVLTLTTDAMRTTLISLRF